MRNLLHYFSSSIRLLFVLLVSGTGWGQTTETFTSGTSWTVPCGVTSVTVTIWGGGGGGGGSSTNGSGGSGGGGGARVTNTFVVTPGTVINYTIGAGGTAGSAAGGTGGSGGQTSVTSGVPAMSAAGGTGGAGNAGAAGVAGANGTSSGGTLTNGTNGIAGGASGGNGGNGGGTTTTFGNGNTNAAGSPGTAPGGGGGGGERAGGTSFTGGAGGSGQISFSYTPSITMPNAGVDQNACGVLTLAGNTPDAGWTGTWSVVSGTASITSPNSPTSTVTGIPSGTCATLRWTFSQVGCVSMTDDVVLCVPNVCNDNACNATPLSVGTTCLYTTVSNVGATVSTTQPEPGCGNFNQAGSEDIWYSAVVPANGILTVNALDAPGGTSMYPAITIYSGGCTSLSHQECGQTTSTLTASSATYTGTPGETIYIRTFDLLGNTGSFQICASTHTNTPSQIVTGETQISCGSSYTFSDPGGNGNYNVNTSAFYTLCPDSPGQYVSVNFTSFSLGSGDFLVVMNGSSSQSSFIAQGSGTTIPATITSSAADGCLQFAFVSNSSLVSTGWTANVTCSSTPGTNTAICSQQDCNGGCGTWICDDGNLNALNSVSIGASDLSAQTNGCFGNSYEVSSNWYYFQAQTTGTIQLSFDGPTGQDYDYAVFGPSTDFNIPCPSSGLSPIRCSFSSAGNPVGLGNGATDHYEEAGGDGWVAPLNVQAGETYALLINIFQNGGPQPVITLGVSGTGALACNPVVLGVNLTEFNGTRDGGNNLLTWITSRERNNDYFRVERSLNGSSWEVIGTVQGRGNSSVSNFYHFMDYNVDHLPLAYYRLVQVDFDGEENLSQIIKIDRNISEGDIVSSLTPNPASERSIFTIQNSDSDLPLFLEVLDEMGKVLYTQNHSLFIKNEQLTIETSNFSQGTYYVRFSQGDRIQLQKLIVIH